MGKAETKKKKKEKFDQLKLNKNPHENIKDIMKKSGKA